MKSSNIKQSTSPAKEDAVAEKYIFTKIKEEKKITHDSQSCPFCGISRQALSDLSTGDKKRESRRLSSLRWTKVNEMGEIGDILSNFPQEESHTVWPEYNSKELKTKKYSNLRL